MERHTLTLTNKISELEKIRDSLERLGEEWGVDPQTCMSVNLALEEAFTNIVNYAFENNDPQEIVIDMNKADDRLTITITDEGRPYDPTKNPEPDTSLPAEDRPIGGLGIFLIRKIMDEVAYERNGNKNHLTLVKQLNT